MVLNTQMAKAMDEERYGFPPSFSNLLLDHRCRVLKGQGHTKNLEGDQAVCRRMERRGVSLEYVHFGFD